MPVVSLGGPRLLATARRYPQAKIAAGFRQIVQADPKLQRLVAISGGEKNVLETLFRLFRDAIRDNNAEKKYFLETLQAYNTVAEALAEALADLVEASEDLARLEKGRYTDDEPYNCRAGLAPLAWLRDNITSGPKLPGPLF
jgi:hypothetical protein